METNIINDDFVHDSNYKRIYIKQNMDYEKKYKEALERAKDCHKQLLDEDNIEWASEIENIFPELRESEDDRISREITEFILTHRIDEPNDIEDTNRWLAWLEKQGEPRQITHEEICKCYGIPDIGEFSDGYHTFNGLYKQRMILFAVLVKTYKDKAWKSWKHEDGELCFGGGWFIVGIDTPAGTYTYHYEARDWDRFDCQILEKGKHWDGHDESDVERLFTLVKNDKTFDYENADVKQKDFAPLEVDGFDAELNALLKKYEHLPKEELQEPLEFYLGIVRDDLDVVREEKPKWTGADDYNVQCCIAKIENDIANGRLGRNKELIEWLKSLKQRMEEQQ